MPTIDTAAREREIQRAIANVDAAGAAGADQDGALSIMAKGLSDGLRGLLEMVKGRKAPMMPPEDDDEPEAGAQGGDEPDEPDEPVTPPGKPGKPGAGGGGEAGGGGGFADMRMGDGSEDMVDATQYILTLEKAVRDQGTQIEQLLRLTKGQNAKIDRLDERMTDLGVGLATTLAPLAKGMVDVHAALGRLPAGGVSSPGLDGNRAAVRHAVHDAKAASPTGQITPQKLMKAVNARILNDADLTLWRRTGRLREGDAENDALIAKVAAV